jgi:hypothetical protein
MIITEIALTLFAGIALMFYAADTLYYIYENEIEKKQKEAEKAEEEKEEKEAEKIKEQISKTLYY